MATGRAAGRAGLPVTAPRCWSAGGVSPAGEEAAAETAGRQFWGEASDASGPGQGRAGQGGLEGTEVLERRAAGCR